jgi:hypothetical protein
MDTLGVSNVDVEDGSAVDSPCVYPVEPIVAATMNTPEDDGGGRWVVEISCTSIVDMKAMDFWVERDSVGEESCEADVVSVKPTKFVVTESSEVSDDNLEYCNVDVPCAFDITSCVDESCEFDIPNNEIEVTTSEMVTLETINRLESADELVQICGPDKIVVDVNITGWGSAALAPEPFSVLLRVFKEDETPPSGTVNVLVVRNELFGGVCWLLVLRVRLPTVDSTPDNTKLVDEVIACELSNGIALEGFSSSCVGVMDCKVLPTGKLVVLVAWDSAPVSITLEMAALTEVMLTGDRLLVRDRVIDSAACSESIVGDVLAMVLECWIFPFSKVALTPVDVNTCSADPVDTTPGFVKPWLTADALLSRLEDLETEWLSGPLESDILGDWFVIDRIELSMLKSLVAISE